MEQIQFIKSLWSGPSGANWIKEQKNVLNTPQGLQKFLDEYTVLLDFIENFVNEDKLSKKIWFTYQNWHCPWDAAQTFTEKPKLRGPVHRFRPSSRYNQRKFRKK